MKTKKEILMPHGGIEKLRKSTGAGVVTIRHALRGITNTELSNLIRKRALEMGGVMTKY